MVSAYRNAGLAKGSAEHELVKALQRDLRALGYLRQGIDGEFGDGTRMAVCRLQHDLLHNDGSSTSGDGNAPCAVRTFNNGRVSAIDGRAERRFDGLDAGEAWCLTERSGEIRVERIGVLAQQGDLT